MELVKGQKRREDPTNPNPTATYAEAKEMRGNVSRVFAEQKQTLKSQAQEAKAKQKEMNAIRQARKAPATKGSLRI